MRKPSKPRRYTSATFGSPSKVSQPPLRFIPSKPAGKYLDVKRAKAQRAAERREAKRIALGEKAGQGSTRNRHVMRHEPRLSVRAKRELAAKRRREAAEPHTAVRGAVSAHVLENLFGVSRQTISNLAQRGIIQKGNKRDTYLLAPSYVRYLRKLVATKAADATIISQTTERAIGFPTKGSKDRLC